MPPLSINGLTTFRWTLDEDILFAKRAGFDAIGMWRRKLADFGEERALDLLDESGLAVSCLSWAGGFMGGDGRSLDESIRDGLAAIRSANLVNAGCLVLFAGGRNNHIDSHADRLLRQGLDELLIAAEMADVTLALKPMHHECAVEWTIQTDLTAAIDLVTEYRSRHLRLVYDNYQFPDLASYPSLVHELIPQLALVQLGDARRPHSIEQERCPLGEGNLPIHETVAELLRAGYNGPIDVELMGSEIEAVDNEKLLTSTFEALVEYTQGSPRSALLQT
ncbi:MAG: sugar phosphate isomerase/epimerase family protein [Aeoliella sp.]